MELDIRYDKKADQFLLFVAYDSKYNLTGRIVARRKRTADPWQAYNGMSLVLKEYEAETAQ